MQFFFVLESAGFLVATALSLGRAVEICLVIPLHTDVGCSAAIH